ncbi:hypothetical protein [Fulvivirga lutimaris]|uniref:hypothetical protein n=1 Tax=Fulvivirga lutimaris TaxID=1819566 RepID=UPI0012BD7226|nr:hypothetical protein [Fulvivirga lutimaris]MTI38574.1 hypothetical protein [Fulvivirga lutimaris]
MSSHHIVRDEQEPALIVFNSDFNEQTIQELLEWSPTVITKSALIEELLPYGFKIDIVIGSMEDRDSIMSLLSHQQPFKYLSKNISDDDLLQAIYYLTASKYKAANLLLEPKDEVLNLIHSFLIQLDLVFYYQRFKWVYCRESTFSKWLPAGALLKFRDESIKVTQDQKSLGYKLLEGECVCEVQKEGQTIISGQKDFWLGQSI